MTAYLACRHLTALSLRVARGELERPEVEDEQAQLLFRKGLEHEAAYLKSLGEAGKTVRFVELEPDRDWERAARDTVEAMRDGVDVVYQGILLRDGWRGQADFLMRVERPSRLGGWSYEALDTKLARHAKPAYILQLCFYSEQLARIQGVPPAQMHVLLGNGEQEAFEPHDFGAYYRRVQARLRDFVGDPPSTTPFPVDQCRICDFKPLCDAYWDDVDHLSRVAGIHRRHIERLEAAGIGTLAALGGAASGERPPGMEEGIFEKLREQAALQLRARETGEDSSVILEPHASTGFALVPDPSPGDLFFDFEGNPFWDEEGSLEYLWGYSDRHDRFNVLWASTRDEERKAFETFVDLVHARLEEHPGMHVYHYAQYEITALRRMMGRYGTREAELDDLLRRNVFVDLYKVVRGGLRISRPGYGLKEVEHLLDFERHATIKDGGTSIVEFERWMIERDGAILDEIAAYNREDCIGTRVLADWLLGLRDEALARFGPFPPPEPVESKPIKPEKAERARLREALLESGDEAAGLVAQLLDYHERERKPVWWAMFDKADLTPGQLLEDREAIGGLRFTGESWPEKKSTAYAFTYPPQEQKIGRGPARPGDVARRRRRARPRHRCAEARAEARTVARRSAAAAGASAWWPVLDEGPGSGTGADRPLAARGRRALSGDRVGAAPRRLRPGRPDQRPRGADGAVAVARRPAPRRPGAAGLRQDVDVGAPDRATRRRRQAGRGSVDEPPRDPQAARRGRRGSA